MKKPRLSDLSKDQLIDLYLTASYLISQLESEINSASENGVSAGDIWRMQDILEEYNKKQSNQ